MFAKLGHAVAHRAKAMLLLSIVLVITFGALGSQVFTRFDSGGYSNPNSDSAKVWDYLKNTFNVKDPALVVVVQTKTGTVDDQTVAEQAAKLELQLKSEPSAEKTLSYWSSGRIPS